MLRTGNLVKGAVKRIPGKKVSAVIICSLLFMGLILSVLSFYFGSRLNEIVKAQIEKALPDISRKWGLSVSIGGVDSGVLSGPVIRDVRIGFENGGRTYPFISIPELRVDYSISFALPLRVRISGVTLNEPVLTIQDETSDSLAGLRKLLADGGKPHGEELLRGGAGRFVSLDRDLHVEWKKAKISLSNTLMGEAKSPLIISRCRGTSRYNLDTRRGTLDIRGHIGEKLGEVSLHGDINDGEIKTEIQGKGLKLIELASYLPNWIVFTEDTVLNGRVNMVFRAGETSRKVTFEGDMNRLGLDHWRIADKPLKDISLHARGVLGWDEAARSITIDSSQLGMGKVAVNLGGTIDYRGKPKIEAKLSGEKLDVRDILKELPREFIPTIYDADVSGHINMNVRLFLDLESRHVDFEPDVEINDFRIITSPRSADIMKLKKPFFHRAKKRGKIVKEFWVGPANPDFVPYDRIGRNAIRAALTCEDGRFFSHDGFQIKHIKDSMRQNLREKRFARGASTISMQTAKNLFLSGSKTISRKFEEMLLTYAMEQEISKERILEIYMNIIEWGPDIYGIGRASRYYFDKKPKDLTLQEAAFLGSIIANPVRYHYMYKNGEVSDHWSSYLALIISKMHADRSEVESIQSYKPEFGWVRKKRLQNERKMEEAATSKDGKDVVKKEETPI